MSSGKKQSHLETTGPNGESIWVPVAEITGAKEGPLVVIIGGTHGSEYVGIEAVKQLHGLIDPDQLAGRLVTIPCLNVPAFFGLGMHINPIDGENPGRKAPGRPDGSYTERMCELVWSAYGQHANLLIDVHGGDLEEELTEYSQIDYCGNEDIDAVSEKVAMAMGYRFIVRRYEAVDKRTEEGAWFVIAPQRGVPAVLAECGSHGDLDPEAIELHRNGLLRALHAMDMLPGVEQPAAPAQSATRLVGFGGVPAPVDGFWYPEVLKADHVEKGQRLGVMRDFHDNELCVVEADFAGGVLGVMTIPARRKGDMLLGYGNFEPSSAAAAG